MGRFQVFWGGLPAGAGGSPVCFCFPAVYDRNSRKTCVGMKYFRSYWYYWHTGHPVVALSSMVLSLVILFSGMVLLAGFSLWGVLLALVLDLLGLMAVLAYALFLRTLVPDLMLEQADFWILNQFVLPVIAAFVVNRLVTYGVARLLLGRI